MSKIAIKNVTVVNEGKSFVATVFILDTFIERITKESNPCLSGYNVIDGSGKYLLPGVIDTHVHFREPGLTHKGDMATESAAAVAGGVTSVAEMPNTKPQTTSIEHFMEKCNIARSKSLVNYSFYIGATNDNIDELMKLDSKQVFAVKVFMGSSTGNMLVDNEGMLERIFREAALPVVTHCEEEDIIRRNTETIRKQYEENPPFSVHPLIRSEEACYVSTQKAVEMASRYNTKLHVAHITTQRELSLFSCNTTTPEKRITAETCVHYLSFTNKDYDEKGALIKCNPAIKTERDREALRDGVNRNLLDIVVTDHAPHTLEEKRQSYFLAPGGMPLVQHSLPMMLNMVHDGIFTIETVVNKMSHAPATIFGIEKRGFIREGYYADLVLVDMNRPWTIAPSNILYKCGWSPFGEATVQSTILTTFVNGHMAWDNGKIADGTQGKQLTFNR